MLGERVHHDAENDNMRSHNEEQKKCLRHFPNPKTRLAEHSTQGVREGHDLRMLNLELVHNVPSVRREQPEPNYHEQAGDVADVGEAVRE